MVDVLVEVVVEQDSWSLADGNHNHLSVGKQSIFGDAYKSTDILTILSPTTSILATGLANLHARALRNSPESSALPNCGNNDDRRPPSDWRNPV
jgi:hypothetical protein